MLEILYLTLFDYKASILQGGTTYSESDGTLNLQDHIVKDGRDSIGVFYEQELVWEPPEFRTSFRTYDSGSIVVFKQQFICPQVWLCW